MAFRSPSFDAVQEVSVGNVVLGRAPVKIISSVCAATAEEMIEQAKAIEASGADIIEWRADYFADDTSWQEAVAAMQTVVTKPVIYTFRSQSEGGVRTEPMSIQLGERRCWLLLIQNCLMLLTSNSIAVALSFWLKRRARPALPRS